MSALKSIKKILLKDKTKSVVGDSKSINESYRESDWQRYQQQDFVVGFEIKQSNNSKLRTEICNVISGKYPKRFWWNGCTDECRCYIIPILMTEEEMDANLVRALNGEEELKTSVNTIKEMPDNFTQYIKDNAEYLNALNPKPSWITKNFIDGDVTKGLIFKTK